MDGTSPGGLFGTGGQQIGGLWGAGHAKEITGLAGGIREIEGFGIARCGSPGCLLPEDDVALEQLQAEGFPVQPEDVAWLSPLVFEHINLLGRYAFSVPEAVLRGELRPLRNPSDSIEEAT
jgi:hypothetical protein